MFTTFPNSPHIWASEERRINHFNDETGMTCVRRHISQLGEADLIQQLWFIRASFTALNQVTNTSPKRTFDLARPQIRVSRERLLTPARAAGDWLDSHALWGENDATWIGLTIFRPKRETGSIYATTEQQVKKQARQSIIQHFVPCGATVQPVLA